MAELAPSFHWPSNMVSGLPASHPLRSQGAPGDVVLQCRQFMSEDRYTSRLVYLREEDVERLPSDFPTRTFLQIPEQIFFMNVMWG